MGAVATEGVGVGIEAGVQYEVGAARMCNARKKKGFMAASRR